MEAKKNPDKDVHRKSSQYFLIGLMLAIALTITAFEWTSEKKATTPREYEPGQESIPLDDKIYVEEKTTPAPNSVVKKIPDVKVTIPDVVTETTEDPEPDAGDYSFEFSEPTGGNSTSVKEESEDSAEIIVIAEKPAVPINGYAGYYDMVKKNLKYPRKAISMGIEGKVYVEFIVNKNGEPSDMKIARGIGAGCDEEAMRVIGLSRWEPARQRGRPVRVRMTMPVTFILNR